MCLLTQLLKRKGSKQTNHVFRMCVLQESEMMLFSQVSLEKTTQAYSLIALPRGGERGRTQMCILEPWEF